MAKYIEKFERQADLLRQVGATFSIKEELEVFRMSLPTSFNDIRNWFSILPKEEKTYENLKRKVIETYEYNQGESNSNSRAHFSQTSSDRAKNEQNRAGNKQSRTCYKCRGSGHSAKDCRSSNNNYGGNYHRFNNFRHVNSSFRGRSNNRFNSSYFSPGSNRFNGRYAGRNRGMRFMGGNNFGSRHLNSSNNVGRSNNHFGSYNPGNFSQNNSRNFSRSFNSNNGNFNSNPNSTFNSNFNSNSNNNNVVPNSFCAHSGQPSFQCQSNGTVPINFENNSSNFSYATAFHAHMDNFGDIYADFAGDKFGDVFELSTNLGKYNAFNGNLGKFNGAFNFANKIFFNESFNLIDFNDPNQFSGNFNSFFNNYDGTYIYVLTRVLILMATFF